MHRLIWIVVLSAVIACESEDTAIQGPLNPLPADAATPAADAGADAAAMAQPHIELTPSRGFVFPPLEVGEEMERSVTVTNTGDAPLEISMILGEFSAEYVLSWGYGADPDQAGRAGITGSTNTFPPLVTVPPDDALTFVLNYRPGTNASPRGRLVMNTNDPAYRLLELPIRGRDAIGALRVSPTPVDFGRVAENVSQVQLVTIENVGQVPVFFGDITLAGDRRFIGLFGETPIGEAGDALADPDEDGTPGLDPGASFPVAIQYTATDLTPAHGVLSIANDGLITPMAVPLVANGDEGCAQIAPRRLDFGAGLINQDNTVPVLVESCGNGELVIERIDVVEGGDVFSVDTSALPFTLAAANLTSNPPRYPSHRFPVTFRPPAEGEYEGRLSIVTNDPTSSAVPIPLSGTGSTTACPTPLIDRDDLEVTAMDIVDLDGSASTDIDGEDGRPTLYTWAIVDAPDGSSTTIVESIGQPTLPANGGPDDDPETPTARLFIDMVGRYIVELTVADEDGQSAPSEACPREPARVEINAFPSQGLHVELYWENGDPLDGDAGRTDLDVHLLHPDAEDWFDRELDCYFGNPNPQWDAQGNQDDPRIGVESTHLGPEILVAPSLSGDHGDPFRLGIHFYRIEHAGQAHIRAYFQDELVREAQRAYAATSTMWHFLDLSFQGRILLEPRDEDRVVVPR